MRWSLARVKCALSKKANGISCKLLRSDSLYISRRVRTGIIVGYIDASARKTPCPWGQCLVLRNNALFPEIMPCSQEHCLVSRNIVLSQKTLPCPRRYCLVPKNTALSLETLSCLRKHCLVPEDTALSQKTLPCPRKHCLVPG